MCWEVGETAESSVTAWRTSLPRLRCDQVSGSSFKLPSQVGDSPREPLRNIYIGLTGWWTMSIGRPTDPNPSPIYCHYQTLLIRYKSETILRQNFFHSGAGESTKSSKHEIWHLLLTSSLRFEVLEKLSLVFHAQNFLPLSPWHPGRPHDSKTCENADETFLVWLLMPAARVWTLFGGAVQAGLTQSAPKLPRTPSIVHKSWWK